jgi:hypothetical protein
LASYPWTFFNKKKNIYKKQLWYIKSNNSRIVKVKHVELYIDHKNLTKQLTELKDQVSLISLLRLNMTIILWISIKRKGKCDFKILFYKQHQFFFTPLQKCLCLCLYLDF